MNGERLILVVLGARSFDDVQRIRGGSMRAGDADYIIGIQPGGGEAVLLKDREGNHRVEVADCGQGIAS